MMCFIVRWQLSSELDRDGDRGWLVRRHLGHCARCQEAQRQLYALHDRLAGSVDTAPRAPVALPRRRPILWLGTAAITATIAGVVVVRSMSGPATVESPDHPAIIAEANEPTPPVAGPSRTQDLAARVASWAAADPLRDELDALKSDALRGARVAFRIAGIR
jgi:hypothetical protein